MRIISMVPSWTETLIEAGADVVGRTRFCVHPKERVRGIPAVGGTKEWNIEKVKNLNPDLIVLDREENTRAMGRFNGVPMVTTHVRKIRDVPGELRKLSQVTGVAKLSEFSNRFESVLSRSLRPASLARLPSVIEWVHPMEDEEKIKTVVYVIWKNPWMAVSRETFIGSMLEHVIGSNKVLLTGEPYPKIELSSFDEESTLFLFSTEPFPFAKQKAELKKLPFPSAIVDGEKWSWFGLRSLLFLESMNTL